MAIIFANKKGLNNEDAEEFAQESCIRSFNSKEGRIKFYWVYADFRDYHSADKRLLSSPQGQLSKYRTQSIDAPISNKETSVAKLGDFIADTRSELGDREELGEIEFYIEQILKTTKTKTRKWAISTYKKYLMENV